jgi:hypothetical protein
MILYLTHAPSLHVAQQLRPSAPSERTSLKKKPLHSLLDTLVA